ncbi:MAG TPA: hypothetical protein VJV74_02775 [Terriglobia bacterium]|nr:hypothetical protein [Terriglobia bacterium]
MKYRIAMWAGAGLLIAGCWGIYFAWASKNMPIAPSVYTLARVTCPVAIAGWYFPLSLYFVLAANAATYALVGLAVEMLRRQFRSQSQSQNPN